MLDKTLSYFEEKLKSDYEVIVVSDGSKDDTLKVAYEYTKR
jgi:glycosyltransferase involved in cell wall biosynthesis